MEVGKEKINIPDEFPVGEAYLDCYYGKIRQGKTYTGTALAWALLRQGNVVKTSWPIEFNGYDERKFWFYRILGIFGLKKNFLVIPKENLHYFSFLDKNAPEYFPDTDSFFEWFERQTDCVIIVDEAQWPLDSYMKTLMERKHRFSLFALGHFNRALVLLVQRPMQIHISARSIIHRYFKIEKTFNGFWFIPKHFKITEFQELKTTDAVPDETLDKDGNYLYAENIRKFWMNMKYAGSYNDKYLRGDMPSSQKNLAFFEKINFWKKEK